MLIQDQYKFLVSSFNFVFIAARIRKEDTNYKLLVVRLEKYGGTLVTYH